MATENAVIVIAQAETEHTTETLGEETLAHAETGMPQLDPAIFPNLIFWLVLALLALYFILSRVALPRIGTCFNTVEAHLADRDADRARALAFEHGAVGKNQKSGRRLMGPRGGVTRAQGCGLCGRSFIGVGHLLL